MSNTPTPAEWIAKRRELEQAATVGPWSATYNNDPGSREIPALWSDADDFMSDPHPLARFLLKDDLPDAAFCADSRTSLPCALDALEAVLEMEDRPATELDVRESGYNEALADVRLAIARVLEAGR